MHTLDDRFTGYTADGAWQDALLGLAHPERIAVVTDSQSGLQMSPCLKLG